MVARGDSDRAGRDSRPHGPPPPTQPRTWQSVEEARAQLRESRAARKGGKAQARRERARVAQRASEVATQRRAALHRHHAVREAQLRQGLTTPAGAPAAPTAPAAQPAAATAEATTRPAPDPPSATPRVRSRAWLAVGVAAGLVVTLAMGVGVLAAADQLGSWTTDIGADSTEPSSQVMAVPPQVPRPGDYVRSRVGADGRLVTEHWIVRDEPIESLTVQPHPATDYATDDTVVTRLGVWADGGQVPFGADRLLDTGAARIDFEGGASTVRLRYVSRFGVESTGSSDPQRALVLVNPLQVADGDEADAAVVRLAAADVLTLACVRADAVPQPCGHPDRGGWRVQLDEPRDVNVVAQVDLIDR